LSIFDYASEPDKSVTAKEVFVYHLFIFSDISLLLIHSLYAILTYLIWPYANGLFYYLGHLTHLLPYQTLVQYENRQSPDWLQLLATSYTSCSLYLSQFFVKPHILSVLYFIYHSLVITYHSIREVVICCS